jgi:hypothetical protein
MHKQRDELCSLNEYIPDAITSLKLYYSFWLYTYVAMISPIQKSIYIYVAKTSI